MRFYKGRLSTKLISALLIGTMLTSAASPCLALERAAVTVSAYSDKTEEYLLKTVKAPSYGSIGGEWAVIGLARSGASTPEDYFPGYSSRLTEYISESKGILSTRRYTEYSRVILAVSSLGLDASDIGGYDLTLPLCDREMTMKQGINGAVFALLALDCAGYRVDDTELRGYYVDALLDSQLSDGGWNVSTGSDGSDADTTAMVLQALAKYRSDEMVEKAVASAVEYLSASQLPDGGFETMGSETAESISQVIIAMCELGISQNDERFVKNKRTPLDALKSFQTIDGGFRHTLDSRSVNKMATEQAFCALTAVERFEAGKSSLYSMGDALTIASDYEKFADRDSEVKKLSVKYSIGFSDVPKDDPDRTAIEALAARGIINGRTSELFAPDDKMTRAEFCTIVVRALGLEPRTSSDFSDVLSSDWFSGYVGKAYSKGIVNGVGEATFLPGGSITREAAAVMVTRSAELCGIDTELSSSAIRDTLSQFSDWTTSSDWARGGLAFCCLKGILDESVIRLEPREDISRREVAAMLYNLLREAELL